MKSTYGQRSSCDIKTIKLLICAFLNSRDTYVNDASHRARVLLLTHVNNELSRTSRANLTTGSANIRGNEFVKISVQNSVNKRSRDLPKTIGLERAVAKSATSRPTFNITRILCNAVAASYSRKQNLLSRINSQVILGDNHVLILE